MSENLSRILTLMEHLSAARDRGILVADLCENTGLANSTVYRLVNDLEQLGYLEKKPDRRLIAKFSFQQEMAVGGFKLTDLSNTCKALAARLTATSELIEFQKANLFWQVSEQHHDQSFQLRAGVGFIRSTYELDSLSRMALAQFEPAEIEENWDVSAFYDVGVSGGKITWDHAREKISAVDPSGMEYDLMGNSKGVRRFCVALKGKNNEFAGLLTAAEAAIPVKDISAHTARMRDVLLEMKRTVEDDGIHPDAIGGTPKNARD